MQVLCFVKKKKDNIMCIPSSRCYRVEYFGQVGRNLKARRRLGRGVRVLAGQHAGMDNLFTVVTHCFLRKKLP